MMIRGFFRFLPALFFALEALLCANAPSAYAESEIRFTSEEENYISSHSSLKIGYVQDRIPVSFADKNGEFKGISRYIFDRVSELCGLDFEYVPLPGGDVTYDYLLGEGFDLVSSVEYNKENQTARGILISDPYLSGRKVVVARDGLDFRYDANLSIAISTGSQTIRKVLGASYPNFELVDYPSITACFDAVNSGEADLMMQNQYVAEHWMSKPIYEKLDIIPVLGLDDQLCFSAVVSFGGGEGTAEEDGRTLINILNKAIDCITEDEIGMYTIQAVMENQYRYTFADFIYRYRYSAMAIAASLAVILALVALLIRAHVRYTENKADEKVRRQFLSTMSHEIRTPLNGLIGLNYLMAQNPDDPERFKSYLRQSNMTANYLISLVNDMLDMSSLQTKDMKLDPQPVDLELIVKNVGSIVHGAMTEKDLTYNVNHDFPYPCVIGDEARIQQVLLNLLDNARKFTPSGGTVTLSLSQEKTADGKILTTAVVSDTGLGMSEEFQKHIFETFTRELDSVSKGNQGTGLGLSISRRLARLMDGELTFISKKGEGSSFTFTFAAPIAEMPRNNEGIYSKNERGTKILIAEDNELNGEIITELLKENGFETELAKNGKVALQMFSDSEYGAFGVILMDLLMPEMDGFETAKAIRALDRQDAKTVRILACTANSFAEDRARALASGMDDFISKPIDAAELIQKISVK